MSNAMNGTSKQKGAAKSRCALGGGSVFAGHTPGPWGYDLHHTVGRHERGEWMESVCQLPFGTHDRRPTKNEKADMLLIAHAPEMLHLLNKLADCYFTQRSEGMLELMLRVSRLLSPNSKLSHAPSAERK